MNDGTWTGSRRKQLWSNLKNGPGIFLEENDEQLLSGQTFLSPTFEPGTPECEAMVQTFHRKVRFYFFLYCS
jgi:hypothetical protein